jgi:hypothetical protein
MSIVVWDIETKGLAGELVIGEILHNDNAHTFRTWKQFFNLLRLLPDAAYVYAHNGGTYDNRYIFEHAKEAGYKIKNTVVINGHVLFTLYINKNKKLYFRDSILLLKSGLKKLCKDFDIEHSKKDFNMINWINAGCPETSELREYLHYDCLSLKEIMDIFVAEIGSPKMTIAGTAFSILQETEFRGKPLKEWCKNFLKISDEEKIRIGYYGGRVEVFIRTCGHAYKYDVNSLYPAVMHKEYYPIGNHRHTEDPEELKREIERYKHLGICKVKVTAPEGLDIPLLPVKAKGKLIFPLGSWSGWYTSVELLDALRLGYKIEYVEGYTWRKKGRLFEPFVSKYYEIKRTSKGSKKLMAKYLLNSSYGKFGQRREHRQVLSMDEIIAQDLDIADFEYINNDILIRDVTSYRNRSINPVYAVFVTAYARKVLYEGMETVSSLGGKVYYVDTDCIITDVKLPASMVSADALGLWDLEEEIKEGVFLAPKLYKTESVDGEHHIKAKGCSLGMRNEIENITIRHDSDKYGHHFITIKTFDKFKKLLTEEGFDFRTKNKKVTGFFEHFRKLGTDKDRFIGVIETKKSISGKYNKRELTDSIHTKPLYFYDT